MREIDGHEAGQQATRMEIDRVDVSISLSLLPRAAVPGPWSQRGRRHRSVSPSSQSSRCSVNLT